MPVIHKYAFKTIGMVFVLFQSYNLIRLRISYVLDPSEQSIQIWGKNVLSRLKVKSGYGAHSQEGFSKDSFQLEKRDV